MKSLVVGAALLGTLGLTAGTVPASASLPPAADTALAAVVVQTTGDRQAAARAVRALGGEVVRDLPIVDGLSARLPQASVARLARTPGVRAVTPDQRMTVQSTLSTTDGTTAGSDLKSVYAEEVGAPALRQLAPLGSRPPRVALVDTGVTAGTDLRGRLVPVEDPTQGKVVLGNRLISPCANFSGEQTCDDTYGHGTFLAGLIAGDGTASQGRFTGIAPQAEIVSVKIAGRDGSADVSKVLAAIQWVVTFREKYGIGVLNLSLGTDSTASVATDPLNHAVQRAWEAGIVVVVAASNRGPAKKTISKPADDPFVLTVGAVDDRETPALSDDRSPAFTGRGPTMHGLAKPDVVAPGVRLVSLRSRLDLDGDGQLEPSYIDSRVGTGGVDASHRRGSGTSQATAVVSGLVALLRQARPTWTPDTVKTALRATTEKVNTSDPTLVGTGLVQGHRAAGFTGTTVVQGARTAVEKGLLALSRGTVFVERSDCDAPPCPRQDGETTQQGDVFDGAAYIADASWTGNSWYDSQWVDLTGNSWYGNSWYGNDSGLYGNSWYGNSWYGVEGDDPSATPFGLPIPGSAWYGVYQ